MGGLGLNMYLSLACLCSWCIGMIWPFVEPQEELMPSIYISQELNEV